MDSDYLAKRAQELDLGRAEALVIAQAWADRHYPGEVRALSLNAQVLKLITPNSTVASELRWRQVELLAELARQSPAAVTKLQIQIRSLN